MRRPYFAMIQCQRYCSTLHLQLGRVVRKPVNANQGLKVNRMINFSCLKIFFTSDLLCSLRLLKLKTEGQKR